LLIHTVNAASPYFGSVRYGDFTHEQAFTASSMTQVLRMFGFEGVGLFEDVPVAHGIKSAFRMIAWKVFRTVFAVIAAAETGRARGYVFSQNFIVTACKPMNVANR